MSWHTLTVHLQLLEILVFQVVIPPSASISMPSVISCVFYRFIMELTSLPKFLWTSDNKLLHHHFPDILATVHTTQDIPEEVVFGPCMLQNTLLDTVAFIALKCSDRRNIHYVFKVREKYECLMLDLSKRVTPSLRR